MQDLDRSEKSLLVLLPISRRVCHLPVVLRPPQACRGTIANICPRRRWCERGQLLQPDPRMPWPCKRRSRLTAMTAARGACPSSALASPLASAVAPSAVLFYSFPQQRPCCKSTPATLSLLQKFLDSYHKHVIFFSKKICNIIHVVVVLPQHHLCCKK